MVGMLVGWWVGGWWVVGEGVKKVILDPRIPTISKSGEGLKIKKIKKNFSQIGVDPPLQNFYFFTKNSKKLSLSQSFFLCSENLNNTALC